MTKDQKLDMFSMRLDGYTLQQIGDKYKITREMVRQILDYGKQDAKPLKLKQYCIYDNLTKFISENRITNTKLSEYLGISIITLRHKLRDDKHFNIKEIKKILDITGMTFEEAFFTRKEDKQ